MIQVIVSDYVVERRMTLLFNDDDFARYMDRWQQTDPLLVLFKDHPFFVGCERWSDLNISQFHLLVVNILKLCADQIDADIINPNHPMTKRLSFLLCAVINLLQRETGSSIDLLRVTRLGREDVLYDYSGRLDVKISAPAKGFRLVIDNG